MLEQGADTIRQELMHLDEWETVNHHLTGKTHPDHLSIVGMRGYGKSEFLKQVANHLSQEENIFDSVVYIDFSFCVPEDDEDFLSTLLKKVKAGIAEFDPDYAASLNTSEDARDLLEMVFDDLIDSDRHILLILDGFDYIFRKAEISFGVWGYLRSQFAKSSITVLTGSRRSLRDLCHSEESRTSDFWNIFYNKKIIIERLSPDDIQRVLMSLNDKGMLIDHESMESIKELTGGIPPLLFNVLEVIRDHKHENGQLDPRFLDEHVDEILEMSNDTLREIYEYMESANQALITDIFNSTEIAYDDSSAIKSLASLGMIRRTRRGKCQISANLFKKFWESSFEIDADLNRLFKSETIYKKNIVKVLKLRLAQVDPSTDMSGLVGEAERIISGLQESDDIFVFIRAYEYRLTSYLWTKEDKREDSGWLYFIQEQWETDQQRQQEPPRWMSNAKHAVPHEDKFKALRIVTGSKKNGSYCAALISKQTFNMLNFLKSSGNTGQHRDENYGNAQRAAFPFCASYAVVACCVEILFSIQQDLIVSRERR